MAYIRGALVKSSSNCRRWQPVCGENPIAEHMARMHDAPTAYMVVQVVQVYPVSNYEAHLEQIDVN